MDTKVREYRCENKKCKYCIYCCDDYYISAIWCSAKKEKIKKDVAKNCNLYTVEQLN